MGVLSEAVVSRTDGSASFKAHAWLGGDGFFEAFWYENGQRLNMFFEPNGKQRGTWKRYEMRLVK